MLRPPTEHEQQFADRLIELSQEEVDENFLAGPFFTEEEVTKHLGTDRWTLTKRFLLRQGEDLKERVIDDYRRSLVNATYASRSYLELQDVDVLAALATYIMRLISNGPEVAIQLQDGQTLRGRLSRAALSGELLKGRCFDLSKAYKQIAVSRGSLQHAVLGARDSKGQWHMYTSQSLPFGATSSVYAFNKSAKALQHLLLVDFSVVTTNYFDDFPTLEFESAGDLTTKTVSQFFQLLGWRHAVTGKKAMPFSSTFGALGVEYNLQNVQRGSFTVGNKADRLTRISRMVAKVADDGRVSQADAASIHGLLNFASGFTVGKALQISAQGFSVLSSGVAMSSKALQDLCEHTQVILESLGPREVSTAMRTTPVLIYTDGAFEGTTASWGAIVLDPETNLRLCFSGRVPEFLLQAWRSLVGEQLICQIELYAVVCIRWQMRGVLHRRRMILFIDNEACRFSLIKGRSPSEPMFRMSHAVACMEAVWPSFAWYERIASACNPADLPSRFKSDEACLRWALQYGGDIALPAELLSALVDGVPFPMVVQSQGDLKWVIKQKGEKQG